MSQLGKRIMHMREARQISQNALAKKSGVAQSSISDIESGKRIPSVPTLERLAAALGVPVTALFAGGDETPGDVTKTGTD
ncbi:MAG: helix-turn-helix transcriptional regulator [Thermoanaerobacterales bacterium]|nr:helix-turn-helix transcriptional regulator [Thermoanaerobacterales bacterium]